MYAKLLHWQIYDRKTAKNPIWHPLFDSFLAIKWSKSKIWYTKFVLCHSGKVHSKFQLPSRFVVQT